MPGEEQAKQSSWRGCDIYVKLPLNGIAAQPALKIDDVGDICSATIMLFGRLTQVVVVYINPGTSHQQIQLFFRDYKPLLASALPQSGRIPLVLCGDFNINLMKESNRTFLLSLMQVEFGLSIVSDANIPTTGNQSCLDLIFARDLSPVDCFLNSSYFSIHKPLFMVQK